MSSEQFSQIVAAIAEGKYSWACLLILRFAGYNPLHYIPYRTYNRLIKNNRQSLFSKGLQPYHRDKDKEVSEDGKFVPDYAGETKRYRCMRLTDTAWKLLAEIAQRNHITHTEVIEILARGGDL